MNLFHVASVVVALMAVSSAGLRLYRWWQLLRAKHPSLAGHARWSRRFSAWIPFYGFTREEFFVCDRAPIDVADNRRRAFAALAQRFRAELPRTLQMTHELESGLSDVAFTGMYRVPFQFRELVACEMPNNAIVEESSGTRVRDVDGHWSYDLTGAYGVNVFGYDFYKDCIRGAVEYAGRLGPVLGPYEPVVAENVRRLQAVSGLDEVSFHMSGTEAVMQAVRLARFHTRRSRLVLFCGAYHGWWDGVQPGVGNRRKVADVYMLREMHDATLRVLESRRDIACVLINPLQALHPNRGAPSDASLIGSGRAARFDKQAYSDWLRRLRDVCTRRGIVLIFDEVFMGFRLARGGAQEYFGVRADIVTYGKTVGGGLPIGVVCGKREYMKRYDESHPARISFARGTFNSHPYVMAAMNEFLRRIDGDAVAAHYENVDSLWNARAANLNSVLERRGLPVRVANLASVFTVLYNIPSRYNWMLQFYLRAEGLLLSWVGTGRLIFSHNYSDDDFAEVADRFVRAAESMHRDGWWWAPEGATNKTVRRSIALEFVRHLRTSWRATA